ncbi:hypothetical protein GE061_012716 [Apolygus lucorum]|uniref:Uncharacterized protein n=1 Tax=Apolygus lucorum TaxID=248454 RepID=A0A6A4JLQ4_APOLU|nr:hypothetical protein GE061_012716 [Apolygus lucorum]
MRYLQNSLGLVCVVLLGICGCDAQDRNETFVKSRLDFLGTYFAGHGEFPWVVEIRTQESQNQSQQEDWSVGNLIGPKYVMTSCSAVSTFSNITEFRGQRYFVKAKTPGLYKVMYSPDFPYQGPRWYINTFSKWTAHTSQLKTGTRQIARMAPHPQCTPHSFRYFFGIVEIAGEPIRPFRRFINYAPAELDTTEIRRKWYFLAQKTAFLPATLSTWGRTYSGKYSQTMLLHYKIKYKISKVKWTECERAFSKYAWHRTNLIIKQENETYCMQIYDPANSMGSICDHDRGSPIIWDGVVIGIVVTAVRFEFCSLLNPVPFVVVSTSDAVVYWTNVERHVLENFIDNSSHVFPGLLALSISPQFYTMSIYIWMAISLLLLPLFAIS